MGIMTVTCEICEVRSIHGSNASAGLQAHMQG